MNLYSHTPVMVRESLEYLAPKPGSLMVDATLGGGGHAKAILDNLKGKCTLLGLDQDADAIAAAQNALSSYSKSLELVQSNFVHIKKILGKRKADGILFDLGVSSYQIDSLSRGFSFQGSAPLDMRMDAGSTQKAEDLINTASQDELEQIIRDFGEDQYYRRIAAGIMAKRPLSTTTELADVVKYAIPKTIPQNTIKSIARVFQAFRIAVNGELGVLDKALNDSIELLAPKGRIVVISYHSLEDRIVKNIFKREASDCICPPKLPVCACNHMKKLNILTKKPLTPDDKELSSNPRSRSAKMRVAVRT